MKEKRYTVTFDAYIYAKDDQEALLKSAQLAEQFDKITNDDGTMTEVKKIEYTPFGSFVRKLIKK